MIDGEEKSLDAILGESLSDAYDAADAAPDPVDAGQGNTTSTDAAPATGQQRDEKGQFTAKTDPGQAAQAPAAPNTDQGQTAQAAPGTDPASEPPASWSAAEKAIWPTLPPDVKAILQRREADFAKGIEQKAQALKSWEPLEGIIGPRRQALAATYGSAENAVAQLFKLSDFADQQPGEFAKWFLQARGINPQEIFGGAPASAAAPQPGQEGQPAPTPELAAVRAEMESLKSELMRAVQAPVIAKAQTDLEKFEAEAGTKYPHYANTQVKQSMAALLRSAPDDMTYEQAYDRVVWSMPDIRQQLIEAERKTAIEAKSKEAAEAATAARRKAGPQLRSVGTPSQVRAAPTSIDQTLSEVYDRAMGTA